MPKLAVAVRNEKRKRTVEKYASLRIRFKKEKNYQALDRLPKDASPIRLRNRCWNCKRSRGFLRCFGICRICFRKMASGGLIPGVRKTSNW